MIKSQENTDTGVRAGTHLRSWEGSALTCGVSTECPNTAPSVPAGTRTPCQYKQVDRYGDTHFYFHGPNMLPKMGQLKTRIQKVREKLKKEFKIVQGQGGQISVSFCDHFKDDVIYKSSD